MKQRLSRIRLAQVRRNQRWRTLALWLMGLLLILGMQSFSGCTQVDRRFDAEEIRIGIIDSLTGDDAESGRATLEAATLAIEEVNQTGGLQVGTRRHPIELVIGDTESKPEVAASVAQSLINQENVVAIIGPQYSRYAIPVSRLAEQARIPMISPRSTNPETTEGKHYVFRAIFTDTVQGEVIAKFAYEELKAKKAAVLYDIASPYNQGIAQVFKQVFTGSGGTVVAFESYTTGVQDFSEHLQTIRATKPDVLFLPNYANEVPLQAKQARQGGVQATLLGADAWGGMKAADRRWLEGAYFSDHYIPGRDNSTTQAFIQRYRQTYGYEPGANAAATYDSMGLLLSVIQQQGSTDSESIREGITTFGAYYGVTGTLEYQGTGDPNVSVAILHIRNGQATFFREITP